MGDDGALDVSLGKQRRKVLRQVDLLLLPLLTFCYGLQFYDKAVLGAASIFGILDDLSLAQVSPVTGARDLSRYSNANAAFYWGYIVAVLPIALLAQRFKANLFLGAAIFLWGIITLLTPAVGSWRGLIAQRFFLGVVESTVSPGFLLVTRRWYTKAELPARVGIWYSATGIFSVLSGLINYGLGTSSHSIATWKVLFIVPGVLTVFFGTCVTLLLPPSPEEDPLVKIPHYNAFTPEARELIVLKTRSQMLGRGLRAQWQASQILEGLCDYKIWIYFAMASCIYVCNGGVTVFGAILLKSMGYSSTRAILLQTPGGATTVASIAVVCILSLRFQNARLALLVLSCLPVIVGAALIWGTHWHGAAGAHGSGGAAALAGYYLLPIFGAPYVMLLSSLAANIAGTTKASFASGAVFVGYNVGNIASSYILKGPEANRNYPTTWKIIIAMMVVTMGLASILAASLVWENGRRDGRRRRRSSSSSNETTTKQPATPKEAAEEKETNNSAHATSGGANAHISALDKDLEVVEVEKEVEVAEHDLTDLQNKAFRYVL